MLLQHLLLCELPVAHLDSAADSHRLAYLGHHYLSSVQGSGGHHPRGEHGRGATQNGGHHVVFQHVLD